MSKKKKLTKKQAKKLYIKLGYLILECKYAYYFPNDCPIEAPSDSEYDKLEERYKKLARLLKEKTTATNAVGFPMNTGSGRLVASGGFKLLSAFKKRRS